MPPRYSASSKRVASGSPFLTSVALQDEKANWEEFPFTLPILRSPFSLNFPTPVTILVGENGSGKSTILEAIAWIIGFSTRGGDRDHRFEENADGHVLGRTLKQVWRQRVTSGFFLRAETFFNFASHLEEVGSTFLRYGGKSLHDMSHGEAFLALFENRFEDGLYILDEPEAALSPQRQLALLAVIHRLTASRNAQFIIATHSPILMAFPGATVLALNDNGVQAVDYRDTEHFRITRDFLAAPDRFFRHLFDEDEAAEE